MSETRRIVLTGVSRGLGLAMTEEFVANGHTVYGCARREGAVTELSARFPSPHAFTAVDVCDDARVAAWCESVLNDGGPPDLLINNAALINANAPLWNVPPEEFSSVIDVNIKGVFHVIRHFVPPMIERGEGVVVNFSSGWGRSVANDMAPYCATKFAIEGLTKALAYELPLGMAAVPLSPGMVHTEMLDSCFGPRAKFHPEPKDWAKKSVPFILNLGPQDNGDSLSVPK